MKTRSKLGSLAATLFVALAGAAACGGRDHAAPLRPTVAASAPIPTADATETSASSAADAPHDAPTSCPADMVLVEGEYCPTVRQKCLHWMDPETSPYHEFRCATYAPSECLAPRVHERYCVDREEYVRAGEPLPLANQSWTTAGSICADADKRLCLESEWQFACEGEAMLPYPYGLTRDSTACNIDQMHLGKPQSGLSDLRAPTSAYPKCMSPFGVHDMSGNVEEWATRDVAAAPNRSTMKGAWWLPGKNTCRAATLGHGETYRGPQVGVRCCKDAS